MCGIGAVVGPGFQVSQLEAMVDAQRHRGPDATGIHVSADGIAGLAHNRLSIIDLSSAGRQPMGRNDVWIVFNGEIYNYVELREELSAFSFSTATDTEVILAAYERWGEQCVEHFLGMFALLIWDAKKRTLFAARDRFGVKPLYYSVQADGTMAFASEIQALHVAGVRRAVNPKAWSTYLSTGLHDHSNETFWQSIFALPAGHTLCWVNGSFKIRCWYDLAARVGTEFDPRPECEVREEYNSLLLESIRLRFRSDVPIGINISGGLDSSTLLGLVHKFDRDGNLKAFTYTTGDPRYDELPWVQQMLKQSQRPSVVSQLSPEMVPELAASVSRFESEPFGGFPTLAYARLFECAREQGVIVLMDGQGMDEQWAGYDYYANCGKETKDAPLQGTRQRALRPECLLTDFRRESDSFSPAAPFEDALRNRQYWDTRFTKIPRALRFNDRVSMRASVELREPFLDHRLFELAFRQQRDRKIRDGNQKRMLRQITRDLLPNEIVEAPKRPVQTPQREWLKGPLRSWANECIETALSCHGGTWLDAAAVRSEWGGYCAGQYDNSFFVWQWVNLGLISAN